MKNILITSLFLIFLGVCNAQTSTSDTTKTANTAVKKYKHFQARYIKANETFTIKLPASMGQGYSWQLADSSFTENLVFEKQVTKNQTRSKPGTDSMQIFYFKAINPGTKTIHFVYGRPFNKPFPQDARQRTYKIIIN